MKHEAWLDQRPACTHTWQVTLAPEATREQTEELKALATSFSELIEQGAFSLAGGPSLARSRIDILGDGVSWTYDLQGVDLRYARVLASNLRLIHETSVELRSLFVHQHPPATEPLLLQLDDPGASPHDWYPEHPSTLPFTLERIPSQSGEQSVTVLIHFAHPLAVETEQVLEAKIACWLELSCFAYPPSREALNAGNFGLIGVESAIFDEQTYEVHVDLFLAADAVWSPLLNMLAALPEPHRCQRVTIE
ncbi:hypothetical protein G6O69_07730 [Pseudenhygromyxa sp. WMMC2535]|uniref:hypothetical protein n=1 Tax=Pseudenhygromyxa sp. WMMC2535 TaxID=2712867 RepID=UPI001554A431|nr:hypothetical protein [Pseudenhygromyxa sp. WMMC2535]NVB37719.1 hypothetical protein [Pseudenhygromyxa sp. WMMC2535]